MSDLVRRLRHAAGAYPFVADLALIEEAANRIEELEAALAAANEDAERLAALIPDKHNDYATGCFRCRALAAHRARLASGTDQ